MRDRGREVEGTGETLRLASAAPFALHATATSKARKQPRKQKQQEPGRLRGAIVRASEKGDRGGERENNNNSTKNK